MVRKKSDPVSYQLHAQIVDAVWEHRTRYDQLKDYWRKNPDGPQTVSAREAVATLVRSVEVSRQTIQDLFERLNETLHEDLPSQEE